MILLSCSSPANAHSWRRCPPGPIGSSAVWWAAVMKPSREMLMSKTPWTFGLLSRSGLFLAKWRAEGDHLGDRPRGFGRRLAAGDAGRDAVEVPLESRFGV